MATHTISRSILSRPAKSLSSLFTRSFTSSTPLTKTPASSLLNRSRPLVAAFSSVLRSSLISTKALSTNATSSSLSDPNPNWNNRPPKETILLDGCDFEHWLVVMEKPEGEPTRDEIIDSYVKTLAQIVGSEEEAKMKMYSVSTRCYFAFGALVSEELSNKLKELPKVRWVLPDSYLDVRNKDYGGEPVINGVPVPYDPKYHEEWIRNNSRANDRNRRNDRPRNFDRNRNFDRRRENMSGPGGSPPPQRPPMGGPPPPPQMGGGAAPPQNYGGPPPQNNMGGGQGPPSNYGGGQPQNNMGGQRPPANYGGPPQPNYGGAPPTPQNNMGGQGPPSNYGGPPPPNYGGAPPANYGGAPPPNYGGAPPQNSMGGGPPPPGWSGNNNNNNYQQQNGGMQQPQYQNNYPPNRDGSGNPYQG